MSKLLILALSLTIFARAGEIETREVEYPAGEVTAKGFLAIPKAAGPHPGILVVHEWWGATEYPRERARKLAALGYTALAVDMYGEGKTTEHPKEAGTFSSTVMNNQPQMIARFEAALDFLKEQESTNKEQIAAIGYCFGGNVVLQMARNGLEGLAGVASFHGALGLREPPEPVKSKVKVLVCNGADDPFITANQIATFKETMEKAGIDYSFHNYEGAVHGFTNPGADEYGKKFGLPLAHHPKSDVASWEELKGFLSGLFADEKE